MARDRKSIEERVDAAKIEWQQDHQQWATRQTELTAATNLHNWVQSFLDRGVRDMDLADFRRDGLLFYWDYKLYHLIRTQGEDLSDDEYYATQMIQAVMRGDFEYVLQTSAKIRESRDVYCGVRAGAISVRNLILEVSQRPAIPYSLLMTAADFKASINSDSCPFKASARSVEKWINARKLESKGPRTAPRLWRFVDDERQTELLRYHRTQFPERFAVEA